MKTKRKGISGRSKRQISLTVLLLCFFSVSAVWAETLPPFDLGSGAHPSSQAQKPYSQEEPVTPIASSGVQTSTGWLMEASPLSSASPETVSSPAPSENVRIEAFTIPSGTSGTFEIILLYDNYARKGMLILNEASNGNKKTLLENVERVFKLKRLSETTKSENMNAPVEAKEAGIWGIISRNLKHSVASGDFGPSAVLVEISPFSKDREDEAVFYNALFPPQAAEADNFPQNKMPENGMTAKELRIYIDSFFHWEETEEVEIEVFRPEDLNSGYDEALSRRPENAERIKIRREAISEIVKILEHKWLPGSASRLRSSLENGRAFQHEVAGIRG